MHGVLVTLMIAFGECRVYHDSDPSRGLEELKEDFINMVGISMPEYTRTQIRGP